jgi:hypothetical protein
MRRCGHADHVVGVREGGGTSEQSTQGLCEACNYATVIIRTPTGHSYASVVPDPSGGSPKSATAFAQQTERSQSSPSPSLPSDSSWCA